MAKVERHQFAHWYNTTPDSTETWVVEGVGVESLGLAYNPQKDQFKTILDAVADVEFDSYQIQSSISGKRITTEDEIYQFVNEARLNSEAIITDVLEVDMTTNKDDAYTALKYKVLITMTEFLGDTAVIGYDLDIKGKPVRGTVAFSEGKPTFTKGGSI